MTQKLAALGFLFVVLNVAAWQVSRWGSMFWEYAYIMRPQRGKGKKKPSGREGLM